MIEAARGIGNPELLKGTSILEEVVKKLAYPSAERWRIQHGLLTQSGDTHLTANYYVEDEGLKGTFPLDEDQSKVPFDIELLYQSIVGQIFLFSDRLRDKMAAIPTFCARFNLKPAEMLTRLEQLHDTYEITSQKIKVITPISLPPTFVEDKYPPSILMVARNHDPFAQREVYGLDQFGSPFGYTCRYQSENDANSDILSGVAIEPIPARRLHYSSAQY